MHRMAGDDAYMTAELAAHMGRSGYGVQPLLEPARRLIEPASRKVNDPDVIRREHRRVDRVRRRGRRVEDHPDPVEVRQADEPLDPIGGGRDAEAGRAGQSVRGRIDACHRDHPQRAAAAQQLDHEVGADVAGTDDGRAGHRGPPANSAVTQPSPPISAVNLSPGRTGTMGPSAPDRMISPARRGMPYDRAVPASQATGTAG